MRAPSLATQSKSEKTKANDIVIVGKSKGPDEASLSPSKKTNKQSDKKSS